MRASAAAVCGQMCACRNQVPQVWRFVRPLPHQPVPGVCFCRSASIIDALPDRPDPASWGGMQPVSAAALTVQGIK